MKKVSEVFLMVVGAALAVLGVLCLINPTGSIGSLAKVVGVVLLIVGVGTLIFVITIGQVLLFAGGVIGSAVSDILFGILLIMFNGTVSKIFIILYALILIAVGIALLIASPVVKKLSESKVWIGVLCFGLVLSVLGVIALIKPATMGAVIFMIPVGLILVLVGAGYIGASVGMIKTTDDTKYFKDVKN